MLQIGIQTKNAVDDSCPAQGFTQLRDVDFSCVDFSLNSYLLNTDLYQGTQNRFFDRSIQELEIFLRPIRRQPRHLGSESIRCICHIRFIFQPGNRN